MSEYSNKRINPCRPGHGASCALCCGSHNYNMPQEQLEEMFYARGQKEPSRPLKHPEEAEREKLFRDAMQCSHMGILPDEPGIMGCLIYGEQDPGHHMESFITGTCRNFYCPAWENLTDRQVLFAARLMGDWYWYSLLINHVEALLRIFSQYENPEDIPDEELESLKEELLERLYDEDGK
ncbi:MAG: hypothetical protein CVV44_19800 [Spirochaetae bacterium HGW-Spirochaetae-1]|nr:MAG: hypothetical protein CVV44_19800 [Spirochaetae bacterium HGW-Spirochaetae-1]